MSSDERIDALLREAQSRIGGEEARADALVLAAHALGVTRAQLVAFGERTVSSEASARFRSLVERRARGEPVAYLVGTREFWSLALDVTPDVLIPRPETERLVELALERIPPDRGALVADLGTGSGAIALAIASERPLATVVAIDASATALEVARRNAERLGIRNVRFALGDWTGPLARERYDLIASNPPYIAANDAHLAQGDCRFEPTSALASGADGLDAIRAIVASAPEVLIPGGWLLLEHGYDQGAAVRAVLEARGFEGVATARDLASNERVTCGRLREGPRS